MTSKQLKALVDTIDLALEAFANRSNTGGLQNEYKSLHGCTTTYVKTLHYDD